jgi:O-antigen/teichoic acid export membrane protein
LILRNPLGLVIGLLASGIYELIYTFIAVKPLPRFLVDFVKVKRVITKGVWVTAFGIFNYIYTNLDNIIVGRMLGVSFLGIYQNAYKISTSPLTEVGDVFFRVTFPVFSKISNDTPRLTRAFIKNIMVNSLLMICAGLFVFIFATPIVKIIFGNGWDAAIPVVKLLSILGVTRGIAASSYSLLIAKSKQKYTAIVTFISVVGMLITIVPLVKSYGIMGAGFSAIIGTLCSIPLTIYYIKKTLVS